ncbi:hypothetical protein ACP70R_029544 [Stipagrostis hirtigluma subsp. patula]
MSAVLPVLSTLYWVANVNSTASFINTLPAMLFPTTQVSQDNPQQVYGL